MGSGSHTLGKSKPENAPSSECLAYSTQEGEQEGPKVTWRLEDVQFAHGTH